MPAAARAALCGLGAGLAFTLSVSAHPLSASQNDAPVGGGRALAQGIVEAMAEAAGAGVDATHGEPAMR